VRDAVLLAPAERRKGPLVQQVAAFPERLLKTRVRPGDEAVE
jgi:hypothetical protein